VPNGTDHAPQENQTHEQTWGDDYQRITGESYSLHGWLSRLHPEDVVSSVRDIVRGFRTRRIDLVYRVRNASGEYVRVRAQVRLMFGEWIGVINCLGRKDSATPTKIASHLVKSVRNVFAPVMVLMTPEILRLFDMLR
jgi:hypothetical protein